MVIWDGSKLDTTDFKSENFLKINSCGFQHTPADYTVVRNSGRSDYHILLVMSGVCEVWFKDKAYTLGKGSLFLYAPGEKQNYSFKEESTSLWLHFTGTGAEKILDECAIKSGVYFLNAGSIIYETYSCLIRRHNQPGQKKLANASLLELLYHISDAIGNSENNEKNDNISSVLTYINMNYNKPLTISELAKLSGYSKSRFSHLFSQITGTTPIKYQNEVRLSNACEMLSSTGLSISEIAYLCGFSDPSYFCRIFSKKYKIPPTKYRIPH